MLNRNIALILFLLIEATKLTAVSITAKWTGETSGNWAVAANWDTKRLPIFYCKTDSGDYVWINYLGKSPGGCTISSGNHQVYSIYVMREGINDSTKRAVLNLQGGSLTVSGYEFKMGHGNSLYFDSHPQQPLAVVNMYDGFILNVNGSGGITIGDYYDAVFNMYGGIYNHNVGGFRVSNSAYNGGMGYGAGTLNLYGGRINVNSWNSSLNRADLRSFTLSSRINVGGGVMALVGDCTGQLNAYANQGLIKACPGQTLVIAYDPNAGSWGTTYIRAVGNGYKVLVDFSNEQGPLRHIGSGFLHSVSNSNPPDEKITALKPKFFRMTPLNRFGSAEGAFVCYDRIKSLGAEIDVVLNDGFKDLNIGWPGDGDDWTSWDNYLDLLINQAVSNKFKVNWDIWNEANVKNYWNPDGTDEQKTMRFFDTWAYAWRKIKSVDPCNTIVGPGTSGYFQGANRLFGVEEFLTFAKAEGVLPDILSWHEWNVDSIPGDVNHARTFMALKDIHIQRISISEYGGSTEHTKPGTLVRYFKNLENSGVDRAMRACTVDPCSCSTCWNVSLDGLLTFTDFKPRSTWWVYKCYADMNGISAFVSDDLDITGIASKDDGWSSGSVLSKPALNFLLGRRYGQTEDIHVLITGLEQATYLKDAQGQVKVVVSRIPDSGWQTLVVPVKMSSNSYAFENSIQLVLPSFGPTDAYFIELLNPKTFYVDNRSVSLFVQNWLEYGTFQENRCLLGSSGDLNGDCRIDFEDYAILSNHW